MSTVVRQQPSPVPSSSTPIAAYLQALRAFSFPASIVPVLLGSALAARGYFTPEGNGRFSLGIFVLTLIGGLLAHAGANVLNDYFDYIHGVDTRPEHGSGVLTQRLLTPAQVAFFGTLLIGAAILCALGIIALMPAATGIIFSLALLGAACAFLYPAVLKRYALGDLLILLSFGLGLTLGAYAVQVPLVTAAQAGWVLLAALPTAFLIDAILHANNIRDAEDDKRAGVRTLATLLPSRGAHTLQAVLLFSPLVLVVLGVVLRLLPRATLAVFLSAPLLIKAYRSGDVPFVAQSHLVFGLLYAIAVAMSPVSA